MAEENPPTTQEKPQGQEEAPISPSHSTPGRALPDPPPTATLADPMMSVKEEIHGSDDNLKIVSQYVKRSKELFEEVVQLDKKVQSIKKRVFGWVLIYIFIMAGIIYLAATHLNLSITMYYSVLICYMVSLVSAMLSARQKLQQFQPLIKDSQARFEECCNEAAALIRQKVLVPSRPIDTSMTKKNIVLALLQALVFLFLALGLFKAD